MAKDIILDRATYKKIKAMNKEQLTDFLCDIYRSGQKDAETSAIDFEELRTKIGAVKGIGEARLNEIMQVIENEMTSKTEE